MVADPHGGAIPLHDVIWVFTSMGRAAHRNGELSEGLTSLMFVNDDGEPEVTILQDPVPRKMISYLARRSDIPLEYFYHMDLIKGHDDEPRSH